MMRALWLLLFSAITAAPGALAQTSRPVADGRPVADASGGQPAGGQPAGGRGADRRRGPVVGVIDFAKVLEAYPRAIELRTELDELRTQRQTELDQDQTRTDEIRLQRDNFKQGTKEWAYKDLELQLALRALDGKRQIFELELRAEREKFYVSMLEDMQRATRIVAEEQGVSLVLRVHEALLDASTETKARVFESRVVWYAAEEIDLTPAVIKLLRVPLPDPAKDGEKGDGGD